MHIIHDEIRLAYERNKATGAIFVFSPWPIVTYDPTNFGPQA